MVLQILGFGFLALVVVVSAIGMLVSRNAIYSAIFLVMNFSTVAVLYLTLGAPFIALTQITVYAGAIMVLFLFVIMLLGVEKLDVGEPIRGHRVLSLAVAIVLAIEAGLVIVWRGGNFQPLPAPSSDFAGPQVIGKILYTEYLLPFIVISFILITAAVGAILVTRADRSEKNERIPAKNE